MAPPPPRPRAPTSFEQRVYALCAAIPAGKVASYGGMAAALGCGSARAVGQAMRRNPFAPLPVPCHRVVSASRDIGGFSGDASPCCGGGHVRRKRAILRGEGVVFERDGDEKLGGAGYWRVDAACLLSVEETRALKPVALDFAKLAEAKRAAAAAAAE